MQAEGHLATHAVYDVWPDHEQHAEGGEDLGGYVVAPQQADGEAQQADDGSLHQEGVVGSVHHHVVQVVAHRLPQR